jgi:hypothetical protein
MFSPDALSSHSFSLPLANSEIPKSDMDESRKSCRTREQRSDRLDINVGGTALLKEAVSAAVGREETTHVTAGREETTRLLDGT